ncbi:MarR family transcriptional regulator [Rhizobium dioscoreae]|uniref:MarR family transcriptional regulator n=1 Tax=Rhizobium dioscoreae TaxID=2653122 RepID=A0ABQ0Z5S0_9HYPH|nr:MULTISPECIES: MarR family transcriptional regulator [Rhizobium]MCZ3375767.1 MarR family transcriptional regulator [Rhizobium sp. AG207R]TWB16213.1 DNA-binding MarR family transcriptional regulator [Rhizobium sp. ERR1071]GES42821.1 MarR family transcriptional regulator [Rhizobium dioscoreae]GES50629.1 MarR family transcriptional regulator [Rhizobium dioscoreae]GLU81610.1 MarR family transcriptional regulator [Rhizobium sp. NBRC 114257]
MSKADRHHGIEEAYALAEVLRPALHRLHRQLRRESDEAGLSPLHALLLVAIMRQPGIGVAELARMEKLRGPTISGHVKAMERDGLIARSEPDPSDRRRNGLVATEKGEDIIRSLKRRRTDWLASELAKLSPQQRDAIRAAIEPLMEIGQ